jgi:hypothetical protein
MWGSMLLKQYRSTLRRLLFILPRSFPTCVWENLYFSDACSKNYVYPRTHTPRNCFLSSVKSLVINYPGLKRSNKACRDQHSHEHSLYTHNQLASSLSQASTKNKTIADKINPIKTYHRKDFDYFTRSDRKFSKRTLLTRNCCNHKSKREGSVIHSFMGSPTTIPFHHIHNITAIK